MKNRQAERIWEQSEGKLSSILDTEPLELTVDDVPPYPGLLTNASVHSTALRSEQEIENIPGAFVRGL
jgi:hypothetical protein